MKIYQAPSDPNLKLVYLDECNTKPMLAAYAAMRQDYSPTPVYEKISKWNAYSDEKLGEIVQRRCIRFNHWGVLEHIGGLVFNVVGFPHDVVVQHRTHRVGISIDCQSQRYTGEHLIKEYETQGFLSNDFINKFFYFPPVGTKLTDRHGNAIIYKVEDLERELSRTRSYCMNFINDFQMGIPCETARRFQSHNIRQHYIFSCNLRSLMHIAGVRGTSDVQNTFRILSDLFMEAMLDIAPVVAHEFKAKRYGKNKLAP